MEPDEDGPDPGRPDDGGTGVGIRDAGYPVDDPLGDDPCAEDTVGDDPSTWPGVSGPVGTDERFPIPDGWVETRDSTWGAPEDDAQYWLFQGYGTATCGPTSVAMVIGDLLDLPLGSSDAVVQRALDLGLLEYDPSNPEWATWGGWSGITVAEVEVLFESYGIPATGYQMATVDTLATYLEAGHSIVLFLDGQELVYGDDDLADGGQAPNHFVEVTGVDYENQVVYLNDPAQPDGAGIAVPMALLEDAWADAGNTMVMTDLVTETAGTGAAGGGGQPEGLRSDAGRSEPVKGTVLAGFTLHVTDGTWIVPDPRRP